MAKSFVLRESIDELTYDFTPHAGSGVIPEPSATQILNFRHTLGEMFGEMMPPEVADTSTTSALAQRVSEYLGQDTSEQQEKLLLAIAEVCSDMPSADELKLLPYRAQQAFAGWIVGTFLINPLPTPATNG